MDRPNYSTSQPIQRVIHLAWPVLVAQLALMANAVIDTAMAGRLSAIDLASGGMQINSTGFEFLLKKDNMFKRNCSNTFFAPTPTCIFGALEESATRHKCKIRIREGLLYGQVQE
jgi:hypothetical protein